MFQDVADYLIWLLRKATPVPIKEAAAHSTLTLYIFMTQAASLVPRHSCSIFLTVKFPPKVAPSHPPNLRLWQPMATPIVVLWALIQENGEHLIEPHKTGTERQDIASLGTSWKHRIGKGTRG